MTKKFMVGEVIPPPPATIQQLIDAIDAYRNHLDDFALTTGMNLETLRDALQRRLDAIKAAGHE